MGRMLLVSPISLPVLLTEETLTVLSSRFQVVPPLVEIRKPTPGCVCRLLTANVAAGGGDDDRLIGVVVHGEDR